MFGLDQDMIFRIPALLIALTVHEYAHARMAVHMGDPTPRFMGRLTLNPIAHLDPIGLIMLWLFKFGWAKPVPINPNNFHNYRKGMMFVSLAGPGSNILMAFSAAFILAVLYKFQVLSYALHKVLILTIDYNIILAIFNLIPIPPLDGSKVVSSLAPGKISNFFDQIEPYGVFILMALIYLNIIGVIIYPFIYSLELMINTLVMLIV